MHRQHFLHSGEEMLIRTAETFLEYIQLVRKSSDSRVELIQGLVSSLHLEIEFVQVICNVAQENNRKHPLCVIQKGKSGSLFLAV